MVVHSLRVSQRLGSKVPMLLKIVTHFVQQLQQLIHLHPIQGWLVYILYGCHHYKLYAVIV